MKRMGGSGRKREEANKGEGANMRLRGWIRDSAQEPPGVARLAASPPRRRRLLLLSCLLCRLATVISQGVLARQQRHCDA
jgi:hypothetical protein